MISHFPPDQNVAVAIATICSSPAVSGQTPPKALGAEHRQAGPMADMAPFCTRWCPQDNSVAL